MTLDDAKQPHLDTKPPLVRCCGRLVLALLAMALVALILRPLWQPASPGGGIGPLSGATHTTGKTVRLIVDYGDGLEKRFNTLTWQEGMTVQKALVLAASHPQGITFSQRGSGEMAFLTAIDGLENQGGGPGAKNWIYRVNGQQANQSFAIHGLQPADFILWTYQSHQ